MASTRVPISPVAAAVRSASLRISSATTAKPRPCCLRADRLDRRVCSASMSVRLEIPRSVRRSSRSRPSDPRVVSPCGHSTQGDGGAAPSLRSPDGPARGRGEPPGGSARKLSLAFSALCEIRSIFSEKVSTLKVACATVSDWSIAPEATRSFASSSRRVVPHELGRRARSSSSSRTTHCFALQGRLSRQGTWMGHRGQRTLSQSLELESLGLNPPQSLEPFLQRTDQGVELFMAKGHGASR